MKDVQGINRGKCNHCECDEYRQPPPEEGSSNLRLRCEYCNHTPVEHVRLIELGVCTKCGPDNCDKYESDEKNCYTDCGYCGCPAVCHSGAEKLKKKASDVFAEPNAEPNASSGIMLRTDTSGKPMQSTSHGICNNPGCFYPVRVDKGRVHEYCSRTCSEQATSLGRGPPPPTSGPVKCRLCNRVPATPGHSWCKQCYILSESEKNKK